jgi:quercetin dioxygenase-like cupin family protein
MPAPSGKTTIVDSLSSRLSELGIELPKPPTPLGAYVESSYTKRSLLILGPLHRISQHITERTEAMHNMKKLILSVFIFTFGFATATHAQQVNTLLTKHLPEAPGKEIEVITVNYAPGAVDAIHRHDAHAVVYVLEGEVEMQVRGGTLQRLGPGQVFYESPEDVHTVSRNTSKTKPAKFVVFFIKNEGAPILTPIH